MPQIQNRRPDLEDLPVRYPEIIGQHLFPFVMSVNEAGKMYYRPVNTDFQAQTGRDTANIGEITRHVIKNAYVSFSTSEVMGSAIMSYDQINSYGSADLADLELGRLVIRSFLEKIEQDIADTAFGGTPLDVTTDIVAGIEDAAIDLQDIGEGDVCLAISAHNLTLLKKDPIIKDRMKNTGVLLGAGGDPRKVTNEQMAAILGVSRLYVGRNEEWYRGVAASKRGFGCLFIEPNETQSPTTQAQLGRTIVKKVDGEDKMYIVTAYYSNNKQASVADCFGNVDIVTLNACLMKTVQIFDGDASDSDSESDSESN